MIASSKIAVVGATALGAAVITGDQITQIITALGVIVFGVMSKLDARTIAKKTDDVAKKTDAAAKVSDAKMDSIHVLVNSAMGAQLKVNAALARRVADLTDQNPADVAIAEMAEKAAVAHDDKQKGIDATKKAALDLAIEKLTAEHAAKP